MGAQQNGVGNIEGILHVPGRMLGGEVQGFEVIKVILHFRPADDLETKAGKNRTDFPGHPVDGVQRAESRLPGRCGVVPSPNFP